MKESRAERVLRMNRLLIVKSVTDIGGFVDFLIVKNRISEEMISEMDTDIPIMTKIRKLLDYVRKTKASEVALEWIEKNVPNLDLAENSDSDQEAPPNKRPKSSSEEVDETDSDPNELKFKTLFTFAKLEKWVSALENSRNMIDDLKNKVGGSQIEALEKKLKDKKLKKRFCFSVNDVKKIDSNQKLKSFLLSQGADFPDLAVDLFFERDTELPPQNAQKQAKKPQRKPPSSDGEDDAPPEATTVDMQQIVSANMQYDSGLGSNEPHEAEEHGKDWATEKDKTTQELNDPATEKGKTTQELNDRLLCEWVREKCRSEEEVKTMFDCISIENQVEHSEYPCFIAEKVMVYTDPQTGVKQIIVLDKKNEAAKKNLLKDTRISLNYQMWVCGVKEAVLINQKEKVINYDTSFNATITKCERLVFEVFAPTLALFKKMQREKFSSLITTTKDLYRKKTHALTDRVII